MQSFKYLLSWLLISLFCNPSYGFINERGQNSPLADDETSLRIIVEKIFITYANRDLTGFKALWSEDSVNLSSSEQLLKRDFDGDGNFAAILNKVVIDKVAVQGNRATIGAIIELNTGQTGAIIKKFLFTLELIKEHEIWKVFNCYSTTAKFVTTLIAAKTEQQQASLIAANGDLLTTELCQMLIEEANNLLQQRILDQAMTLYRLVQDIAEKIGEKSAIARALNGIANVENAQGKYGPAMEHFQQSLVLSEELKDRSTMAGALNGMASIESAQSKYAPAMKHFQQSLALSEELKDKRAIAATLIGMGIVFASQSENEKTLDCFQKSLTIYQELQDKIKIVNTLNNIGNIYRVKNEYSKALDYLQRSLALRKELNSKVGLASTYNNIALIYMAQGDKEQALDYLNRLVT